MKRPPMRRLIGLLAGLALAMSAIVVRLAVLQVGRADAYQDLAFEQRVRSIDLPADRGRILDRTGEPLALSVPARDVYADPRYVLDAFGTAVKVAPLLDLEVAEALSRLTRDTSFVYLARQVDVRLAERVEALGLPGIGFLPASRRAYPAGALASQVLGFVGIDGEGLAGLELQYQDELAGIPGERTQELGLDGQPIAGGVDLERLPVAGSDLATTVDRDFQYQVQAALEQAVAVNRAQGGTVIVMDPRTGEILAMATYPWFDPNGFAEAPSEALRNRAVTDAFEPGSVNKVITAAAAVEERVLPLDRRLVVASQMRVGDFTIHDAHEHPVQRMTLGDIIAQSSNIGAVKVAELLGEARMAEYLAAFGLGEATGIGFPGEAAGLMLALEDWSDTSLATMAYGQGIAVTPLQMLSVYATIANDGVWVRPRLVLGTYDPKGAYHPSAASPTRRVVSARTARIVAQMLATTVESGTGTAASIPGYQVAGKTGTARIPREDGSGYYTDRHVASFIGFLPASDPEVVIAAVLDRPATVYGGIAAAPLFKTVARYAIARLGIAPGAELPAPPLAVTEP